MPIRRKRHDNRAAVVLSVSQVYVLTLVAEFPRFRGEFADKAKLHGFDQFIDLSVTDPFAGDLRYLDEYGYLITDIIPASVTKKRPVSRYSLTAKGAVAIHDAMASYAIIAAQADRIPK